MSKATQYFLRNEPSDSPELTELIELPARYAGLAVSSLEGRKGRSFWESDADWSEGYTAICIFQEAILMGAKEDIIREIRGVRGGQAGVVTDDLTTYPVGAFPGYQLKDISLNLVDGGLSVAQLQTAAGAKLEEIRVLLEAAQTTEGGQLDALLQIAALLAV